MEITKEFIERELNALEVLKKETEENLSRIDGGMITYRLLLAHLQTPEPEEGEEAGHA